MLAYCVSFGFILVTFQGKLSQAQTLKSKRDGFNSTYPIPIMTLSTSPVGKESTHNAGDPGSIPWSGRSAGEGIGYTPVFWPRELHLLYIPMGSQKSWTQLSRSSLFPMD